MFISSHLNTYKIFDANSFDLKTLVALGQKFTKIKHFDYLPNIKNNDTTTLIIKKDFQEPKTALLKSFKDFKDKKDLAVCNNFNDFLKHIKK